MSTVVRRMYDWKLRTRTLELGRRTLLMGILNVTPDSFSDGGLWFDSEAAVTHALEMLDAGADVIDVGAESTRPDARPLTADEEQARLMPVLQGILRARSAAILSVDTYHAQTAKMAVEAGAEIVNDVSGGLWDSKMAETCAALGCGVVLMHTRARPQEWRGLPPLHRADVMPRVMRELAERAGEAMARGVARESIVLDPGFGFGKALEENFTLLVHFGELRELDFPVLAGVSRKGFLRRAIAQCAGDVELRLADATNAAGTVAVLGGAHILRVHEIGSASAPTAVADEVLRASGKG